MDEECFKFYKEMLKDQLTQTPFTDDPLQNKILLDNFYWGIYQSSVWSKEGEVFCKPIKQYFDKQGPELKKIGEGMEQLKEIIDDSIKDFMKL